MLKLSFHWKLTQLTTISIENMFGAKDVEWNGFQTVILHTLKSREHYLVLFDPVLYFNKMHYSTLDITTQFQKTFSYLSTSEGTEEFIHNFNSNSKSQLIWCVHHHDVQYTEHTLTSFTKTKTIFDNEYRIYALCLNVHCSVFSVRIFIIVDFIGILSVVIQALRNHFISSELIHNDNTRFVTSCANRFFSALSSYYYY